MAITTATVKPSHRRVRRRDSHAWIICASWTGPCRSARRVLAVAALDRGARGGEGEPVEGCDVRLARLVVLAAGVRNDNREVGKDDRTGDEEPSRPAGTTMAAMTQAVRMLIEMR